MIQDKLITTAVRAVYLHAGESLQTVGDSREMQREIMQDAVDVANKILASEGDGTVLAQHLEQTD
jgi:hypothetical protein